MSNKLIDLNALSTYKTSSDAKYQDKLTAGAGISISNNVISATASTPTFSGDLLSGSKSISRNTITKVGEVTLQPGIYYLMYSCQFANSLNGYRQIGFSTNTTDITGLGWAFMDSQEPISGTLTTLMVNGIFEVSASEYPNGRTFYFLVRQQRDSAQSLTAYPRAYYIKF